MQPLASAKLWEQLREACTAFFQVRACAPCMPCRPAWSARVTASMLVCFVWLHVSDFGMPLRAGQRVADELGQDSGLGALLNAH